MKAVFRVSNRLRAGAPIPRDFLPIPGLDHLGLCYQQRIFSDPVEFNATLATLNDPRFPRRGATVDAYMLTPDDEAKMVAKPAPVEPAPEPVEQVPVEEAPAEAPINAWPFTLEGSDIHYQGQRVATIHETGLRCAKGYAELREQIEAWLQSQPQ